MLKPRPPSDPNARSRRPASSDNRTAFLPGATVRYTLLALLAAANVPSGAVAADCPVWHADRDADGFGDPDPLARRVSCVSMPGYVPDATDCNDFSSLIYPGAPDAWWGQGGDCNAREPVSGPLLYVNCNHCAPGDLSCDLRTAGCSSPSTGCNMPDIQTAINLAPNGATIEICQGFYPGNLDFLGKAITVRGRLAHSVVLTGDGSSYPAVRFTRGESSSTRLSNVVITAGLHGGPGGGMLIRNSSPTLEQVSFLNNALFARGGALYIEAGANTKASPLLRRVSFSNNRVTDIGGGLGGAVAVLAKGSKAEASPVFEDVLFASNAARSGGALHVAAQQGGITSPKLTRVRFFRNMATGEGAAMAFDVSGGGGNVTMSNLILEKNTGAGEALFLRAQAGSLPIRILNSTLVGNDAAKGVIRGEAGPGGGNIDLRLENNLLVFNYAVDTTVNIRSLGPLSTAVGHYFYNDLYANGYVGLAWPPTPDSGNNIAFDPRFRGYEAASRVVGDLTLGPGSPALNAGNPDASFNEASGDRNDLGAYGGPGATWPAAPIPAFTGIDSPEPSLDDLALARLVYLDLAGRAPTTVTCEEQTLDGRPGEWVSFSSRASLSPRLDVLGLREDTAYRCTAVASSAGGMSSYMFDILTPPLPHDLQNLWRLSAWEVAKAQPGYTLFNVFPATFNPHYLVLVDMFGDIRWYHQLGEDDALFDPDPITPDIAVDFIPETAQILIGGGLNLEALPQLVPLSPADPMPIANLTCASAQDEIYQVCAGIEGSNLPAVTPDHDAILSADRRRVLFICDEQIPLEGATPQQYCTDAAYRQDSFSVEEVDISNPTSPVHTWRFSGRQAMESCQIPRLPGADPYHANGLWREDSLSGSTIFISLRHRNQILKVDRATGEVLWKLGPLTDEDMCPADTMPDPSVCPGYDPVSTLCPGRYYPQFSLIHDTEDTTCPSIAGYAGPEEQDPQWFFGQHAPYLIRGMDGQRTLYVHDNGRDAPDNVQDPESRDYTRALRMVFDEDTLEARVDWQYCRGTELDSRDTWWAPAWGSVYPVQRVNGLPTGHTLIDSSHCTVCVRFEDTTSENSFIAELEDTSKQVLWSLDLGQDHGSYRAERIDGCYRLPGSRDFLMGTNTWCHDPQAH